MCDVQILKDLAAYAPIVTAIVAAGALIPAFLNIRMGRKIKEAEFVRSLYLGTFREPEIRKIFYQIEYRKFQYDEEFHGGSQKETELDGLLIFMNTVLAFRKNGILSEKDFALFKYEFTRVCTNPEVQKYFDFLRNFIKEEKTTGSPYACVLDFCDECKIGGTR